MPAQNGVWRHDGRDLREDPTPKRVTKHRQAPAFIIGQPQLPTAQLRLEDATFGPQKLHHIALFSFQPAEQRREHQVKWNHTRSLRD